MHTREKAIHTLSSYLRSDERFLLLTGTYQNRKHLLALSVVLSQYPSPATILFRANHSRSIRDFLAPMLNALKEPKIGTPINVQGGYTLYADTINRRSWPSSPYDIDVAIIYPLDSLGYEAGDECVQDLVRRKAKKILLISWTDNRDFGWTDQFSPVHVVYDAEQEDPEYHKRMIELLSSVSPRAVTKKLPDYAKPTSDKYLIKILCRRCNRTRWARLNAPYPGKSALRKAEFGKYEATCLKCGYRATDNYNWFR